MVKKVFGSLLLVVALTIAAIGANAQVCKISNSNDNVEVFSCRLSGDKAVVTLSNDSNDITANVTVTVEVNYGSNVKRTYSDKIRVEPGPSATLEIPIEPKVSSNTAKSVKVVSITGTKCL